jgi:uncharacterized DUF497 family protein
MEFIFTWNKRKARANLEKHKVNFDEAKTVFNDPLLVTYPDELHSEREDRLISIGMSTREHLLLVVHVEREETAEGIIIRIISCRKATPSERRNYEKGE